MKLSLFSQNITESHISKLKGFVGKPFDEVNFLYINTPGNYKPYKSEWMMKGEQRWKNIFPNFQEFDIERAFRVDKDFDFKTFFSNYDFIFVSGGNTFVLSYWMGKTGAREILKEMIKNNEIIYGGESAGAVFTYKDLKIYSLADDPNKAIERIDEGLDIVDFAPIPHWEVPEYQSALVQIKKDFEDQGVKTYTMTNNEALFVEGGNVEIV